MTLSIRINKRNALGEPIEGRYEEFECNSAAELAEWYYKRTARVNTGRANSVKSRQSKHTK